MRRARPILLAAVAILALATPAAAGGKPDRFPSPSDPLELPGGVFCDFDLRVDNIVDQVVGKAYPATSDGAVRLQFNGHVVSRVTNVDTGESIVLQSNAKVTIWLFADGSATATFAGGIFAFYTAEEAAVSSLDQGVWYVRGHGTEHYGVDGSLLDAQAVGNIVDLCAALSG